MKINRKTNGFTLIELLIVIAIIGALATVVLSSLNSARVKAHTAQRVSNLSQLKKALETYYLDHGSYPFSFSSSDCQMYGGDPDPLIPELVPDYILAIAHDPVWVSAADNTSCSYYQSNGIDYKFTLTPEETGFNFNSYPAFVNPARDGGSDNCVYEPGYNAYGWDIHSPGGAGPGLTDCPA